MHLGDNTAEIKIPSGVLTAVRCERRHAGTGPKARVGSGPHVIRLGCLVRRKC